MGGEGRGADDGVVAPVLAVAEMPEAPGGEHRTIDMTRELLHPREQRVAIDRLRRGLDHADVGVGSIMRTNSTIAVPAMTLSASSMIM